MIGQQSIGVGRRAASFAIVILLLAIGCGSNSSRPDAGSDAAPIDTFEIDADVGTGFLVRGTAIGIRRPVTLEVVALDRTETLVITQDGPFSFRRRVPDQTPYSVTLASAQACGAPGGGTVANADVELPLVCDGVNELRGLVFDVPVALATPFDPDALLYSGNRFPYLLEAGDLVGVTPDVYYPADTAITIGGAAASHGQRFELPFSLATPIDFALAHPGMAALDRTYRLASNARTLLQETYV